MKQSLSYGKLVVIIKEKEQKTGIKYSHYVHVMKHSKKKKKEKKFICTENKNTLKKKKLYEHKMKLFIHVG